MDFKQIQELIKQVSKTELTELKIEDGDFKITIRNKGYGAKKEFVQIAPQAPIAPAMMPATPPVQAAEAAPAPAKADEAVEPAESNEEDNANYITVKSPMIGTFYRSPGPEKDAFVKVGDSVDKGTVLCIIEAMKLFNEIESEFQGKIIKVLAEDASPVEYDQPLFIVDPS